MRSRRAPILWIGTVTYATAIFVLSSLPVPAPAEETMSLVSDKALHALEYAGFAALLALAIASTPSPRIASRAALIAFAGAVLYAASDEFHQTLVAGRRGTIEDVAADAIGGFVGAAAVHVWRWRAGRTAVVSETSYR